MSAETWSASAPSNIAIIKYMGKAPGNLPLNPSLSYTTPDCYSTVSITVDPEAIEDTWVADDPDSPLLTASERARFLRHVQLIKAHYGCEAHVVVRGKNNFPLGCGLASSASSFAALTQAVSAACASLTDKTPASVQQMAQWSRVASGSSCRSFYTPWSLWDGEQVSAVDLPLMWCRQIKKRFPHLKRISAYSPATFLWGGRIELISAWKQSYLLLTMVIGGRFLSWCGLSFGICMRFLKPPTPALVI